MADLFAELVDANSQMGDILGVHLIGHRACSSNMRRRIGMPPDFTTQNRKCAAPLVHLPDCQFQFPFYAAIGLGLARSSSRKKLVKLVAIFGQIFVVLLEIGMESAAGILLYKAYVLAR